MKNCLYCGKPVKNKYCDVSCQNKAQGAIRANNKYGEHTTFKVTCHKCNTEFEVVEREKLHPQKKIYYCSRNCANSRTWSDEDKKKKSESLAGRSFKRVYDLKNKKVILKRVKVKTSNYKTTQCKNCNKNFEHVKWKKRTFCSQSCQTTWGNLNTDRCRRGGRKSAEVQKETRRSKNEIYFSELCETRFENVKTNEPIFNGWDADIILMNEKIAILWNGVWHYKKITEAHSVKQVQNRDEIKIKEIIKSGFTPYVIKDMGRFNEKLVKNEFEKLLKYIAGCLELVPDGVHIPD